MTTQILKRVHFLKFIRTFPPINPGSLLMAVFCSFLIVIATFTPIPLRVISLPPEALINPGAFFASLNSLENIWNILIYIPQMPVVIMIACMLGPGLGFLSTLIYIAAGLAGLPVFASGGGIEYFSRLGFGYILGFFAGVLVTGKMIKNNTSRPNVLKSAIIGIITIHLVGIVYLAGTLLFTQESLSSLFNWVWQLSGTQILYDMLFGIIAAFIGRIIRVGIWLVTD
jgi:biotin transport system substrate-specific component